MKPFQHTLRVEDSDIDVLGHANNTAYIRWIQDVAVAHSAAVGFDYPAYQRVGAVFVVRRHEVDYLKPAGPGEEIIARTWVTDVRAAHCLRHTEILRAADGAVLARGVTNWVFVNLERGRPTRIPPAVLEAFGVNAA